MIDVPETLEVIELRHGLEVQAARLAAEVIDTDALQELGVHLATMEADKASFEDFVAADMNVHQVVAAAAADAMTTHMCSAGPADAAPRWTCVPMYRPVSVTTRMSPSDVPAGVRAERQDAALIAGLRRGGIGVTAAVRRAVRKPSRRQSPCP